MTGLIAIKHCSGEEELKVAAPVRHLAINVNSFEIFDKPAVEDTD